MKRPASGGCFFGVSGTMPTKGSLMNESQSLESPQSSPKSRRFPDEFKRDAVRLVTDEQYTFKAAVQAVGVSVKSLYDWHKKFAPPPEQCGEDATVTELQTENKRLRKELKRAELEREIARNLKKSHGIFCEGVAVPFLLINGVPGFKNTATFFLWK